MTDLQITQAEADALIALEKHAEDDTPHRYPALGGYVRIPLLSHDGRESFMLDVRRNEAQIARGTYQNRSRTVIVLARLDFGGPPHRNPDDDEVPTPHLHVYREGFADKWAFPLDPTVFSQIHDPWQTLIDFMRFVNITRLPNIEQGLFP